MDAEMNRMFQLILNEISGVKQEVTSIKQEATKTNSWLDRIEQDVSGLKQDVTKINIRIENEIVPNIKLLAESQQVLPQMGKDIAKMQEEQEEIKIKLDALSEVVPQHSKSIQELKKKAL